MDDCEIVRDALLTGNLSLALAYLQWQQQQSVSSVESEQQPQSTSTTAAAAGDSLWKYARRLGRGLVYQALCQDQLDLAGRILLNMGEQVQQHLIEVAWHTVRRSVRNRLLQNLRATNALTPDQLQLVEASRALELLYPNPYFSLQRMQNQKRIPDSPSSARASSSLDTMAEEDDGEDELYTEAPAEAQSQQSTTPSLTPSEIPGTTPTPGDLDDMSEEVAEIWGFRLKGTLSRHRARHHLPRRGIPGSSAPRIVIHPMSDGSCVDPSSATTGIVDNRAIPGAYGQFALAWLRQWNPETLDRLALARGVEQPPRSLAATLTFYSAHSDWHHLSKTLRRRLQQVDSDELETLLVPALNSAVPFVRQLVIDQVGRRHHPSFGLPLNSSNPHLLLRHWARAGKIFSAADADRKQLFAALTEIGSMPALHAFLGSWQQVEGSPRSFDADLTNSWVELLVSLWGGVEPQLSRAIQANARALWPEVYINPPPPPPLPPKPNTHHTTPFSPLFRCLYFLVQHNQGAPQALLQNESPIQGPLFALAALLYAPDMTVVEALAKNQGNKTDHWYAIAGF